MVRATLHWQNALDRLPVLINIGRMSLLLSLLTFHVLSNRFSGSEAAVGGFRVFTNAEIYTWAMMYGALIIATLLYPQWQNQGPRIPNANAVADITMMVWLMQMAGGIGSGFGILVLPFVATSCLLSRGRHALLYASYASLLVILAALWQSSTWNDNNALLFPLWVSTVMQVASFYLVAVLTAFSAAYLVRSQKAYAQQALVLERFRGLTDLALNHVQEAVVVLDGAGVVRLLNRQARYYFPSLLQDKPTDLFTTLQQQWAKTPKQAFDMDVDIRQQPVRARARPLHDGDMPLLMLFIRSGQDLAQEAMASKLAALGQLTANLAHEIRNPMSAIRQANGLLQEDETNAVRQRLNNMIETNIARIDKMLEDVSALNKSDKTRKQVIDLMQFWRDFRQEFVLTRPQAQQCIRLKVSDGRLQVWCDPMHLQQILWNLFNNAWRHSRQDAEAVRVVFQLRGQSEIAIMVMDNGEGVKAEHQPHLFEPFFTTESEGTGLGLYVARELAQANMGRLSYRASINGFELILPRVLDE